jgi:hypothetical protein
MTDAKTIRKLPYLYDVPLDEERLEKAQAEGWLFDVLPDGQCLIDAVDNEGILWLAPTLALGLEGMETV